MRSLKIYSAAKFVQSGNLWYYSFQSKKPPNRNCQIGLILEFPLSGRSATATSNFRLFHASSPARRVQQVRCQRSVIFRKMVQSPNSHISKCNLQFHILSFPHLIIVWLFKWWSEETLADFARFCLCQNPATCTGWEIIFCKVANSYSSPSSELS